MIKGSGVLPYAIHNKKIYFLLGQEEYKSGWKDSLKWADFGGHLEENLTIKQNAIKELMEETRCILGTPIDKYEKILDKCHKVIINGYICYIIKIPYKDYSKIFKNSKNKNMPEPFNEIRCIKWFSANSLIGNKKNYNKFRRRLLVIISKLYS